MNQVNHLKLKSLFKKFDYYMSDLEWKSYLVNQNEKNFLEFINNIVQENDQIDFGFELEVQEHTEEEVINEKKEYNVKDFNIKEVEKEIIHKEKDPKLKRIYRSIVKITHPDKVNNQEMNQIYLKATNFYNNDDILNLYRICNDLGIDYDIEEKEEIRLISDIKSTKKRISFLENSFVYKWCTSDDEDKYIIGLEYLNQLSNTVNQF